MSTEAALAGNLFFTWHAEMKFRLDFSIATSCGTAFGHAEGELDFAIESSIGDTISLMSAPNGAVVPRGHVSGGHLKVVERIVRPTCMDPSITLLLEDMIVDTASEATATAAYLKEGFGLFVDAHDQSDANGSD